MPMVMRMATLQVKRLPDDLYAAVKEKAASEGRTVSDYVTALLRRDVSRPSIEDWLRTVRRRPRRTLPLDIEALMDEVRGRGIDA